MVTKILQHSPKKGCKQFTGFLALAVSVFSCFVLIPKEESFWIYVFILGDSPHKNFFSDDFKYNFVYIFHLVIFNKKRPFKIF